MAPGGDQVEPDRGFARGRGLLGVEVDAPTAAVDLAGAQRHRLLRGLRQRRLRDHQAGAGEPLAELGADLVVEHAEPGFHGLVLTRGLASCVLPVGYGRTGRTRDAGGPVRVTAPPT